jgi:hypothetical protein
MKIEREKWAPSYMLNTSVVDKSYKIQYTNNYSQIKNLI